MTRCSAPAETTGSRKNSCFLTCRSFLTGRSHVLSRHAFNSPVTRSAKIMTPLDQGPDGGPTFESHEAGGWLGPALGRPDLDSDFFLFLRRRGLAGPWLSFF